MELCDSAGAPVGPAIFEARRLTPYAARMRYGSEVSTDVTRAEAASWAAEAIAWARGVVGSGSTRG
jgi:hypothetical protein